MDFSKNISYNIKKLREMQHVTQEQLANAIGISYQAISKWENGITTPDISTLPVVAQFFGVSIDDLFREKVSGYENEAVKWLAKYEASHNQDDFMRADIEYKKLFDSGNYELDDIRSYGVLYEYHMYYCKKKALEQYDRILAEGVKDNLYYRTCRQKSILLSQTGQGDEDILAHEEQLEREPENIDVLVNLINACFYSKKYEKGMDYYEQAEKLMITNNASMSDAQIDSYYSLYVLGGDIYKALKKYEKAFACWESALELNTEYMDALYSIGFCYEELGNYSEAAKVWQRVIDRLMQKGYTYELSWPRQLLEKAKAKSS